MNMLTIARTGYPEARIILLKLNDRFITSRPGNRYIRKSRAYGSDWALAPKATRMLSINRPNTVRYAMALITIITSELPSTIWAPR